MLSLTGSRSRTFIACAAFTLSLIFMLALVSRASATYLVPNFTVTAAPVQAASHPKISVSIDPDAAKADSTGGDDLKDLTIDAPAGLQLNQAAATTKCTDAALTSSGGCPTASLVGTLSVKWRGPLGSSITTAGNAYVMTTPSSANSAQLGFVLKASGYKNLIVRASVSNAVPVSAPTRVTITSLPRTIATAIGINVSVTIDQIDAVLNAKANSTQSGPYFTLNPSACGVNTTQATLLSYTGVSVLKSSSFTTTGCSTVPFRPTAAISPTVPGIATNTGFNATFTVPTADAATEDSTVKTVQITFPKGVLFNFPAIASIPACTDAKVSTDTCPSSSKIGATNFSFPPALPAWSGDLYLTASGPTGFSVAGIARGANGATAVVRGTAVGVDTDNDGSADLTRLTLSPLPGAAWSSATLNLTSPLLRNQCPTGQTSTSFVGASASTVVKTTSWYNGVCDPAPETTLGSVPPQFTNNPQPAVSFSSPSSGATFQCSWDSVAFLPCSSPAAPVTPLADGLHQVCVRAVNGVSVDASPACASFTVDTVGPTIVFQNPNFMGVAVLPLAYSATDASGTPTCTPANGTQIPLTLGDNAITVTCVDAANNATSSIFHVYFDPGPLVPPTVAITSPANGLWTSAATINVAYTVDGAASIPSLTSCTVNGVASTSATQNTISLVAGPNNVSVTCVNHYGATTATIVSSRDNVPPAISNPSLSQTTAPGPATLSYSAQDNSGLAPNCTPPSGSIVQLVSGVNTITVVCVDAAGNAATQSLSIVIAAPQPFSVSITSGPSGTISTPTATFSYAASELLETTMTCNPGVVCPAVMVTRVNLSCSLDSTSVGCPITTPYGGTYTTPSLANGAHIFCVTGQRVSDGATSQACRSFTVQVVPPPQPSCSVNLTTLTCTFTVPAGYTASCALNGGAPSPCVSPAVYPNLIIGSNTWTFCLTDSVGASSCQSRTVTAPDNSHQPTLAISSPGDGLYTRASSVTLHYVVSVQDGSAITCNRANDSTVSLAEGLNTITVTCTTPLGNFATASVAVTRDITPPSVVITSPVNGSTVSGSTATITYVATDDSGPPTCTPPSGAVVPLNLGPNTITVVCYDQAGNVTQASVGVSRSEEGDVPQINITSPANGLKTMASSIPVSYSVSPVDATCNFPSGSSRSLVVGTNNLTVTCTSASGSTASATVTVTRGAAFNPGSSCSASGNTITCNANPSGGFAPYTKSCSVDSSAVTCGVPTTVPAGTHAGYVCAADSLTSSSCIVFDFITTPTAPVITITSPSQNFKTTNPSAVLNYTVSVAGAVCDKASGSSQPLVVGSNTLTVTCTDPATGAQGTASVTGQRANPLSLNPGCNVGGPITVAQISCFPSASGGFPPYVFSCTMDGGPTTACGGTIVFSPVIGTHVLNVCVTDSTGATICASYAFTYTGGGGGGPIGGTCPPGMVCTTGTEGSLP